MPKLVDYAARFAFLRRAAFVVVRDHGPEALSRRSVAAMLGMSDIKVRRFLSAEADLRQLALDEVDRLRRQGRWGRPRGLAGPDLVVFVLRQLLPDEEARVPEELVYLRLAVDACHVVVADDETAAALRAEHAIADRGYLPDHLDTKTQVPGPGDDPLARRLSEHHTYRAHVVDQALAVVGVGDEQERRRTLALLDGLTLDTCLGRITPEDAVTTVELHVASLATGTTAAPAPCPPPR